VQPAGANRAENPPPLYPRPPPPLPPPPPRAGGGRSLRGSCFGPHHAGTVVYLHPPQSRCSVLLRVRDVAGLGALLSSSPLSHLLPPLVPSLSSLSFWTGGSGWCWGGMRLMILLRRRRRGPTPPCPSPPAPLSSPLCGIGLALGWGHGAVSSFAFGTPCLRVPFLLRSLLLAPSACRPPLLVDFTILPLSFVLYPASPLCSEAHLPCRALLHI